MPHSHHCDASSDDDLTSTNVTTHSRHRHHWRAGLRLSIPVALGYLPAGIAFGVLAQVAGVPMWATLLLSVLLYAGAAQYACLPMLSTGLPVANIATNVAAINLRHIFYALPLLQQLPTHKLARAYCLFALTDETFSVLTSLPVKQRADLMLPVSLFNQGWWVLATALGIIIGPVLNDWVPNLDFALLCLFVILAYEQFCVIKRYAPIIIATVALFIAAQLTEDWLLLTAICISIMMTLLQPVAMRQLNKLRQLFQGSA